MSGNWYVQSSGTETGPLSDSQLRAMAAEGQLSLFSSVRKGQSGDWVLAGNVRGLFQPNNAVKTSAADLPSPDPPPAPEAAAPPTSAHSSAEYYAGPAQSTACANDAASLTTCPDCRASISRHANSCPKCGKPFSRPNRYVAVALALFLGGLGAHKFYLKNNRDAILYLLFFWTFIPAVLGFVEGLRYLAIDDETFAAQHESVSGSESAGSNASSSVVTGESSANVYDRVANLVNGVAWFTGVMLVLFSIPFLSIGGSRLGALLMIVAGLYLVPPIGDWLLATIRSKRDRANDLHGPRIKTSAIAMMSRPVVLGIVVLFLWWWGLLKVDPNHINAGYNDGTSSLRGPTPAAVSEEAFDRMGVLAVANDFAGIEALNTAGLTCMLPARTKVRIIDLGLITSEIKVEDGPYAGTYLIVATNKINR